MSEGANNESGRKGFREGVVRPFRENWSETVHYIILSFAIIGSAFWAVWTLNAFSQRDQALQDLENAKSELTKTRAEIKEIEERLDGNFSSDIAINSNVVALEGGGFGLILDVEIKNVGSKDVTLRLDEKPLTIYKLRYQADKVIADAVLRPEYYHKISSDPESSNVIFPVQKVLVGAAKKINFFAEVSDPGVYYVTFEASLDIQHQKRIGVHGAEHLWFSSSYIHVGGR